MRLLIIFFLLFFISKAIAEPTFVQSKTVAAYGAYFGLTFNNDGTKMYTVHSNGANIEVSTTF